jgi:hypothetical protein
MCWSDFPTPLLLRYPLKSKKRVQSPNLALASHLPLQKRYEDASIIQLAILHILAWLCCARAHDYIRYFVAVAPGLGFLVFPSFCSLTQLRWMGA